MSDDSPTEWTPEDQGRLREIRRDYYLRVIQIRWSTITPRQRKRLMRNDPLLAIAIKHLVEEGLIP